ncbi:MAG: PqqD family protein [Candidatus Omnitrophica bacterium]|nr:PqqD family protein [Candidatus Omnitrophota bacterium]MCM8830746.1 PqqD family protein [Candidatus Omnitrophota bacterium]
MQDKVYKKNPNFVAREIANELVLVPIYKSTEELNCIYTLNEHALYFWKLLDGKRTLENIKKELLKKFSSVELDKNLEKLIKELLKIKAIKEANET